MSFVIILSQFNFNLSTLKKPCKVTNKSLYFRHYVKPFLQKERKRAKIDSLPASLDEALDLLDDDEIINNWFDSGLSEELVTLALKEATYNGVSNLRYIDKIIYEWGKKGIKTKEDVEKDRKKFKSNSKKKELFDYDWLNDENNN